MHATQYTLSVGVHALQVPADSDDQADKVSFPQTRKNLTGDTLLTQILQGQLNVSLCNVGQKTKNKTWDTADE